MKWQWKFKGFYEHKSCYSNSENLRDGTSSGINSQWKSVGYLPTLKLKLLHGYQKLKAKGTDIWWWKECTFRPINGNQISLIRIYPIK